MQRLDPILAVASIERSLDFYKNVLGFEPGFTMPGPDGTLVHGEMSQGAASFMLGKVLPEDAGNLGKGVVFYMMTDDVDGCYERVRAAGATIVQEPEDQFWGHRTFRVSDPDGYLLEIAQMVREMQPEEMLSAAPA